VVIFESTGLSKSICREVGSTGMLPVIRWICQGRDRKDTPITDGY
jgi:hypothetical protein